MDWKFFITLVATLAGVVVPVWLWQADMSSKSVSVSVISTAELRKDVQLAGLGVTIDGRSIDNPTVVELSLKNTGSRPIASADFEGPLEILVSSPAVFLRADPKGVSPPDLKPTIETTPRALKLTPLLLNPRDTFQITVLLDGRTPTFSAAARISGVSTVQVIDEMAEKRSRKSILRAVLATGLLYLYTCASFVSVNSLRRRRPNVWAAVSGLLALTIAASLMENIGKDYSATLVEIAPLAAIALALAFVTRLLLRSRSAA